MHKTLDKDIGKKNLVNLDTGASDMGNRFNSSQSKKFNKKWNQYERIKQRRILMIVL